MRNVLNVRAVVAALVITAAVWRGNGRVSAVSAASVTEPVVAARECALLCLTWELGCDSGKHLAILESSVGLNATWGTGPHYDYVCRSGSCSSQHPWCDQNENELTLEDLRVAVLEEDAQTVAAVLSVENGSYSLNTERSAVQVSNCKGDLLAHLPVSRAFAREVQLVVATLAAQ